MSKEFYVNPIWDDEAKVWYSESNIKGLHIETKTIEEFCGCIKEYAGEMLFLNHGWTRESVAEIINTEGWGGGIRPK